MNTRIHVPDTNNQTELSLDLHQVYVGTRGSIKMITHSITIDRYIVN